MILNTVIGSGNPLLNFSDLRCQTLQFLIYSCHCHVNFLPLLQIQHLQNTVLLCSFIFTHVPLLFSTLNIFHSNLNTLNHILSSSATLSFSFDGIQLPFNPKYSFFFNVCLSNLSLAVTRDILAFHYPAPELILLILITIATTQIKLHLPLNTAIKCFHFNIKLHYIACKVFILRLFHIPASPPYPTFFLVLYVPPDSRLWKCNDVLVIMEQCFTFLYFSTVLFSPCETLFSLLAWKKIITSSRSAYILSSSRIIFAFPTQYFIGFFYINQNSVYGNIKYKVLLKFEWVRRGRHRLGHTPQ